MKMVGSGCGSVGRAVASDTRGPQFEPIIRKIYLSEQNGVSERSELTPFWER